MLPKDNSRVNDSMYDDEAKKLFDEISKLLFAEHSFVEVEHNPNRKKCTGFSEKPQKGINEFEKRICKCLFYFNSSEATKQCESCVEKSGAYFGLTVVGDYEVVNYEVPPHLDSDGAGNIDLLLSDRKYYYATEIKPATSPETLLRMFLEICTYCNGDNLNRHCRKYGNLPVRKAICFFENSNQYNDFMSTEKGIYTKKLLKMFDITVFCLEVNSATKECRFKVVG